MPIRARGRPHREGTGYLSVYVTLEWRRALENVARQERRTLSEIARFALEAYILQYEQTHPELEIR